MTVDNALGFFDDFPRFLSTSRTASSRVRLNLRHKAMIEANSELLSGATVLDIASHDGRWSLAALKAGASHVTGIEARQELVESARRSFDEYGVDTNRYHFIAADVFEVMRRVPTVDVVLCLGFMYHTLRYPDLLHGIRSLEPRYLIVDTKVARSKAPIIRVVEPNDVRMESMASSDAYTHGKLTLAGWPSLHGLNRMLDAYDFELEAQHDWPSMLGGKFAKVTRDYTVGERVTLRYRSRGAN